MKNKKEERLSLPAECVSGLKGWDKVLATIVGQSEIEGEKRKGEIIISSLMGAQQEKSACGRSAARSRNKLGKRGVNIAQM